MPVVYLSDAQWKALSRHSKDHASSFPGLDAALAAPLPDLYSLIRELQDTVDEVRAQSRHPQEYDALSRVLHDAWIAWLRKAA